MAIQSVFDPGRDGWFFENWGEAADFDWSLYRRTYLAINPTEDPVAAPLDSAFFQIFKSCAAQGNCGGMSLLAVALFKYGGYMGYGSPASFYTGINGPDRADLHEAINIMQARQFSAAGIRNFLDVVKAGELNDGVAAFKRIQSGLASGDYCVLSLSNGLFGDAAHTIIPFSATESGGTRTLLVWNSNRPFDVFPTHYNGVGNRITITSPTSWRYDQGFGGTVYDGSNNGWFFAIPTSLIIHKGRQPISPGFVLTGVTTLFVSGTGAAVTQIEDDDGNRLYTSNTRHSGYGDRELDSMRQVEGVVRWPWAGGLPGEPPGELFFIERAPGSSPLSVSVSGDAYQVLHLGTDHLTRLTASAVGKVVKDKVRLHTSFDDDHTVDMETRADQRDVSMEFQRQGEPGTWKGVRLQNTISPRDQLQLRVPVSFDTIDVTHSGSPGKVDVEFLRHDGERLVSKRSVAQEIPEGKSLRLAPENWEGLSRTKIETAVLDPVEHLELRTNVDLRRERLR